MTPSRRSRRREASDFRLFERAGESSISDSNQRLPRAQERVQQAIEAESLWGHGGEPPIQSYSSGRHSISVGGSARHAPRPSQSIKAGFKILARLQYRAPARTLVCQQRGVRKEVLFARRVAGFRRSPGRGGGYRRRQESQYGC